MTHEPYGNEDGDRDRDGAELIGRLFTGSEPPHRNFADTAIEHGAKSLRRDRALAVSGTALGVAAAVAVSVTIAGTTGGKGASAATSPAATGTATKVAKPGTAVSIADKERAKWTELQAALGAVMPQGVTVTRQDGSMPPQMPSYSRPFMLNGQSGQNILRVTNPKPMVSGPDTTVGVDNADCRDGFDGAATSTKVAGGTVYTQTRQVTFKQDLDAYHDQSPDWYDPSSLNRVKTKSACYTFVPSDAQQVPIQFELDTQVDKYVFADKAPANWAQWQQGSWPPGDSWTTRNGYDPDGLLLSARQFAAMVTDPAFAKVALISDVDFGPGAPDSAALGAAAQKQLTEVAKGLQLPAGFSLKLGRDDAVRSQLLLLVTPKGTYSFSIEAATEGGPLVCQDIKPCSVSDVPGGQLKQGAASSQNDESWEFVVGAKGVSQASLGLAPSTFDENTGLGAVMGDTPLPKDVFTQAQALALLRTPDLAEISTQIDRIVNP